MLPSIVFPKAVQPNSLRFSRQRANTCTVIQYARKAVWDWEWIAKYILTYSAEGKRNWLQGHTTMQQSNTHKNINCDEWKRQNLTEEFSIESTAFPLQYFLGGSGHHIQRVRHIKKVAISVCFYSQFRNCSPEYLVN